MGDNLALHADETQFRVLAESLPQLVWITLPDGNHLYFNRKWYEFTGLRRDPEAGPEDWLHVVHPDDQEAAKARWDRALSTGKTHEIEYRIRGVDGRYRWFLGRALPMRGEDGAILRWFGTCTDIDAQKRAEDALRRLDKQHRIALEAAELGTWDQGVASGVISWDERSCDIIGIEVHGIRSLPTEELLNRIHEEDQPRVRELMAAALDPRSDGRYDVEYRIFAPKDGSLRWLHLRGQTFFTGEGANRRAVRMSGVLSDVTQRRTAAEAQQLLTRELNHRVKNLFAIASGMVSMTARTAATPKEMAEALRGRLGALSRAHELVRPAMMPEHGGQATTVDQLARSILAPYGEAAADGRIAITGSQTPIGANTTTSLALVLHEFATNAAKYGSLSAEEGRLTITCTEDEYTMYLTWTESGGPPVPTNRGPEGFGSQLARKSITGQLGGTLEHDWRPEGLVVHIAMPLDRLAL